MKIFQIYNEQRSRIGGEPAVIDVTTRILEENGHSSRLIMKSSRDLENSKRKQAAAFFTGAYDAGARREMRRMLTEDRPDLVHVHSVYPRFSPSILYACRDAGVPVVMTVHTHNLTCPAWFHLRNGATCVKCLGGREIHCVLHNCRNNILESTAYALRSAVASQLRLFQNNVNVFMVPTKYSKSLLLRAGYEEEQVVVVPNPSAVTHAATQQTPGTYVAFAGRVSPEKGVDVLLKSAEELPQLSFKIAGDGPALSGLKAQAPPNVEFMGRLAFPELQNFYRDARMLVVPSVWFEPFGMVAADAMTLGVPVIASRIGGLPDVVEEGVTGLLFDPGDAQDLSRQISYLWNDTALSTQLGRSASIGARRKYSQTTYYENLMDAYHLAIHGRARNSMLLPILT